MAAGWGTPNWEEVSRAWGEAGRAFTEAIHSSLFNLTAGSALASLIQGNDAAAASSIRPLSPGQLRALADAAGRLSTLATSIAAEAN